MFESYLMILGKLIEDIMGKLLNSIFYRLLTIYRLFWLLNYLVLCMFLLETDKTKGLIAKINIRKKWEEFFIVSKCKLRNKCLELILRYNRLCIILLLINLFSFTKEFNMSTNSMKLFNDFYDGFRLILTQN